MGYNTRKLLFN